MHQEVNIARVYDGRLKTRERSWQRADLVLAVQQLDPCLVEHEETYELAKSDASAIHSSTPPGMSAFVALIYSKLEAPDPSQMSSETLVSLVSKVVFPLLRSMRFHHVHDEWLSKEYWEVEKRATS